jgi:hypothetical protein
MRAGVWFTMLALVGCAIRDLPDPGIDTSRSTPTPTVATEQKSGATEDSGAGTMESSGPVVDGPDGRRAFGDLARFYADETAAPPYEAALDLLLSDDEDARERAGGYLNAILQQSFADETNGRSPYKAQIWWGAGPLCVARQLRKKIAEAFGERAAAEEALDAAMWLIDEEKLAANQTAGFSALRRMKGARVNQAFVVLLGRPHPNPAVVEGVLAEVAARGTRWASPLVARLCTHYRTSIRKAAREAAASLGLAELQQYRPAEAVTPWLGKQLENIAAMVLRDIPPGARWCTVACDEPLNEVNRPATSEVVGWLVGEENDRHVVVDWFAQTRWIPKKTSTLEVGSLAAAAERLIAVRAGDSRGDGLSRRGRLTGQFEPESLRMPEALVAAWCYVRGDRDSTAKLLFPRIEAMDDDRWLGWMARDYLGHRYHQDMLVLFGYVREYEGALQIARHLSKRIFEGYEYHERARELAAQLDRRRDDFKTFVLPAPREWEQLKAQLPRAEQICYLAERLRLLDCARHGRASYSADQFGIPLYHARGEVREEFPRINPYVELFKMDITVAELPELIPYLADEQFMPTFTYWREFHPKRTLHRVNWAVVDIVNRAAMCKLADLERYGRLNARGRREYLDGLVAWCVRNGSRTPEQLVLEAIRTATTSDEITHAAYAAVRLEIDNAAPLLAGRVNAFPSRRGDMARSCYHLRTDKALAAARDWVGGTNEMARFYAACILLEHGDRAKREGFAEIADVVRGDDSWLPLALEPMLATGDGELRTLAASIIADEKLRTGSYDTPTILHILLLAGVEEAVAFVCDALDSTESGYESKGQWQGTSVKRVLTRGDRLARQIVPVLRADGRAYSTYAPPDQRKQEREEFMSWLRTQVERIRAGEDHELRAEPRTLRRAEWRLDVP